MLLARFAESSARRAEHEHDLAPQTPLAVRTDAVRTQPGLTVVEPLDAEQARTAVQISARLHGQPEVVSFRLIREVETEMRSDFGGAELTTDLSDAVEDLLGRGAPSEAQILDLRADEWDPRGLGERGERLLVHDVLRPVTREHAGLLDLGQQLVLRLTTDRDGSPDVEGRGGEREKTGEVVGVFLDPLEDSRHLFGVTTTFAHQIHHFDREVEEAGLLSSTRARHKNHPFLSGTSG